MKGVDVVNEMMTGADLIVYITENDLLNKPIIDENGVIMGFVSGHEVAVKMNVGYYTVLTWVNLGMIPGIRINDEIYIPANYEKVLKEKLNGSK